MLKKGGMAPVLRHCPCLRPESDDVRVLDYSHSNLDDVPNEVFGYERTLEELFLEANQIKDLPRPLFHCHGLRKLNLSDNEVQTLPSAIASLINLEHLDISKNGILEIPDGIKGCKCLTVIDASVNPLGKLSEGFTFLINLQELYLNDTFLEYLPANFGRLSHLRILEFRENHLKLLPKSMARLIELSRLDIGQNDMTELPEVIGMLPRLVELWCDCNNLNSLPPFLGGLKKLAYLDASKNKIYEVAEEIEGCISLCDLTLSSNRIKVLPDGIANLKKLTVLRVDENRMVSVPANIGNLCNLEELVLSSNNLTSLPPSLGLLRNLRTLISDDNLLEELPCEIGSCLKLTILSLRDNKLVQIPDELGHITALKVINLSGNLLQYLPFSIAKLPNLQALWLSENQNKPLIPLQSDTDRITGQKVLTCFMLPQVPLEEDVIEESRAEADIPESGKGRHIIKFAFDSEKDQPSKLVRAPTPYPKELKAHARHARNYALKKQGSKDSEGNEVVNEETRIVENRSSGLHATGATPDIMILPNIPPHEPNAKVKEAAVIKPKSPLSSPKHERHYIQTVKDPSTQVGSEVKPHVFLEQNPLQISHQISSEIIGGDITAKVLGRRDSRGDGSSSENTSTSATGSPKLTPDSLLMDGGSPLKIEAKESGNIFKKNIPPGKRDTWLMRQRLLKQGSGDSDRGYRSDHEVYMAEKDQYGNQCYHDGYASDWEAFLAKQNSGESAQGSPHYVRHQQEHQREEMVYRGHAEGQEIMKGEVNYQWDPRYHYPPEAAVMVDDEYQARMGQAYNGYWQTDPASGQFYPVYDMSHSYPPTVDNPAYIYSRNQGAPPPPPELPPPPQPYYEDCDGYKHIAPQFWTNQPPNPPLPLNPPPPLQSHGTVPRRLGAASPRLKRSQCLSVQAPLHGTPQEYHLVPQGGQRLPTSPRPGCSPSPDQRVPMPQYSPQPYQKFSSGHYQYDYPITTQPVNATHFPLPPPPHPPYYSPNPPPPMYPTLPPSPRMKQVAYNPSTVDDSALSSRPYPMLPNVHNSNFYAQHPEYAHQEYRQEMYEKVQDAEYSSTGVQPGPLHYRSGSIPAQIQDLEAPSSPGMQHFNRSVPSINIIPSTSPPQTSYMTEGWRGDPSSNVDASQPSDSTSGSGSDIKRACGSPTSNTNSGRQQSNSNVESQSKPCGESDSASNPSKRNELGTTSSGSHVIVSPKTQKAMPPPQQSAAQPSSDLSNKKDIKLPDNNQGGFRKPGCFQAVPVNIPSVHSVLRKKESIEERPDSGKDAMNKNQESISPKPIMRRSPAPPPECAPPPVPDHNPEAKRMSGYVGGIINNINKSINVQTKEPDSDVKKDPKKSDIAVREQESNLRKDQRSVQDTHHNRPNCGNMEQDVDPRRDPRRVQETTQYTPENVSRDPRRVQETTQFTTENVSRDPRRVPETTQFTPENIPRDPKRVQETTQFTPENVSRDPRRVQETTQFTPENVSRDPKRVQETTQFTPENVSRDPRRVQETTQFTPENVSRDPRRLQETTQYTPDNISRNLHSDQRRKAQDVRFAPDGSKKDFNDKPRPGYPVQVRHSKESSDRPPELPKKDKTAVTMRNIIPNSENKPNPHHVYRNTAQDTQNKHTPDKRGHQEGPSRHSFKAPDSPKPSRPAVSQQDRIAWENDKNKKYSSKANNATSNQPPKQSLPSDPKPPESDSKSSDKRFQKVLPPIDPKSFQLKPCAPRKDQEQVEDPSSQSSTSPAMPPKNHPTKPLSRSDSNVPPVIPPKRSSMVGNATTTEVTPKDSGPPPQTAEVPPTVRRLERTTSLSESEHIPSDVVRSKDVHNEKNEQLQKGGNMPDLISKMVPEEDKNELIIMEQQPGKVLRSAKSEEDELSKDNFTFSNESEKDGGPESPKSPKRQSWFFGTHKNSMVFPVIVSRDPELGFSIEGGIGSPRNPSKPYDNGIYVAHVLDSGPANNLLRPGDKILQVDGKDFTQLDHNKAVALLQESGTTVSLMISRQ